MERAEFSHNLNSQIIGEIIYEKPYQFTFVYPDNRRNIFNNIKTFLSMKTGCYVLIDKDETVFVVRANYDYVVEKIQPAQ